MTAISQEYNETADEFYDVIQPISYLNGYDYDEHLRVDWNSNLNYAVKMVGNGNQSDFYVMLMIDAGYFSPQQEKQTTFYWIDAVTLSPTATYYDASGAYSVEYVNSIAVSNDGNYLFTSSWMDNYVSVMNITDKTTIAPLATYYDSDGDYSIEQIYSIAVSGDDNYLFTSSAIDDYVSIMNITDKTTIVPLATYHDADGDYSVDGIMSIAVSGDDNYLFTSSYTDDYISIMHIELVDETLPTYSTDGHNTTAAGADVLFSILYDDDTALHPAGQYIFSTNNTGTWTNESAVNFTATPNWANVSKTLNSTGGLTISYRWYADDNAGNINDTGIFTLTTTSADTCTCPDINNDWNMDMSDWCNITDDCNLGTGKWNLTGVGEVRCNATITTTNMQYPPSGSILWIQNDCWIKVT
jgi:WD40 repeat protein